MIEYEYTYKPLELLRAMGYRSGKEAEMREVKIREASNGYIVEYWGVPTKFGDRKSMLELNCTEVHEHFSDLTKEIRKYFGEQKQETK